MRPGVLATLGTLAGLVNGIAATASEPSASTEGTLAPRFRVQVENTHLAWAVSEALNRAFHRLASDECGRVVADFQGPNGRSLQRRLETLGCTAHEYLGWIVFADGDVTGRCRRHGTLAVTEPGSRVVFVCRRFARHQFHQPVHAELILIHEALHSLGLGEGSSGDGAPSSDAITRRVAGRCGR